MVRQGKVSHRLSDSDLEFLVGEVAPNVSDPQRMMRAIRNNEDLRAAIIADDRVFERVVQDEEILIRISAALYFEVLLRRASKDLESSAYTVERSGKQRIAVFDADSVTELLAQPPVLYYLAGMMASFTRIPQPGHMGPREARPAPQDPPQRHGRTEPDEALRGRRRDREVSLLQAHR